MKEIEFPYMSPSADTPENQEKMDLGDNVPLSEKPAETGLDTALNEMIPRVEKGLKKPRSFGHWSFGLKISVKSLSPLMDRQKWKLKVYLIADVPRKENMQRYATAHLNFMYSQVSKLEQLGHVKSNPGSRWSS
jgi:hypothetical protein